MTVGLTFSNSSVSWDFAFVALPLAHARGSVTVSESQLTAFGASSPNRRASCQKPGSTAVSCHLDPRPLAEVEAWFTAFTRYWDQRMVALEEVLKEERGK